VSESKFSDYIVDVMKVGITASPGQENSTFDILANKLYSKNGRQGAGTGYEGYALKFFPWAQKSERPR
jgi:hypothetical protein